MSRSSISNPANSLKQRLLQDIAELQANPYPNIELHIQDHDLTTACLVLTVEEYGLMHMTIDLPANFPLSPPAIRMDSDISHPNIFGNYICASILNTTEGYTPAYTLKGIAIQLLSFFSSDRIEQSGGGYSIDIARYRDKHAYIVGGGHICTKCRFGMSSATGSTLGLLAAASVPRPPPVTDDNAETQWPTPEKASSMIRSPKRKRSGKDVEVSIREAQPSSPSSKMAIDQPPKSKGIVDMKLPKEVLLLICDNLEAEELMVFSQAWAKISRTMIEFDVIRSRELQCFCFKKNYKQTKLGVGVGISSRGKIGSFSSEFDLLSHDAFAQHYVRRSVQGVEFEHWLGLPISQGHWRNVRDNVSQTLVTLTKEANLGQVNSSQVIFAFMNDVVVKLNQETEQATVKMPFYPYEEQAKSTLTHASEKAIESYFHLFHLLICLATEDPSIIRAANQKLDDFANGKSSKDACPNLGHLLVAALISDRAMTEKMMKSIIKETVIRNVIWMLDRKGANMPELSYLEPSPVSEYRLQKTFDASKTSYRLLMFLNLFRRTAVGSPRKPLAQLRDEAFERHGAPPKGSAKGLADSIKRIHEVSNFPEFLKHMGISPPPTDWFTNFLRECVQASMDKGYSRMPMGQDQALFLRQVKERDVEVPAGLWSNRTSVYDMSFFPARGSIGGGRGGGNRGGYGRGGGGRGGYRGGRR